VQFRP